MRIRTKVSILILLSTLAMVVMLAGVSLLSFRSTSLENEREHGEMASELARNELLLSFLAGDYDHEALEKHIRSHIADLHEIRIVRTQATEKQYGKGTHEPNDAEKIALRTGTSNDRMIETAEGVKYQYITPYYAEKTCLQCHDVNEGTLLGLVNIELDLTDQRASALSSTYALIAAFIVFAIVLGYILRQLLMPIVATATSMRDVVAHAKEGNFSGRMEEGRNDELGQVATQTNHLMDTLEQSFGTIIKEVESMEVHSITTGEGNLLTRTVDSVKTMVGAVRFKQTIEEDRNLGDVYERIFQALTDTFQIKRFSLYEVNHDKQLMKLIYAHGLPEEQTLWCNPEVNVDSSACRACRTAHDVNSEEEENICTSFAGNRICSKDEIHLHHFCIPLMQGGRIGVVLQIIHADSEAAEIKKKLPFIRTYFSEASPVIESKRLTEVLHASTLKDPMTDLYNRRFLDQFKSRLIASAQRSKKKIGLLMCDVDFFKDTNDTYGHKVGDTVLIATANILAKAIRPSDYVIRYGGEEFLVVISEAEEEKTLEIAERIRKTLEENQFNAEGSTFNKTLSIGVAIYADDSDDLDKCIHLADTALYVAKDTGRNQVIRYQEGMEKEDSDNEG
ncbi:diguanylate cyclase [Mariprofundus sp. NF]|uniref:diguanylate cyclase n=1 Tax=Mariprofundus sp. NF TaxID=2608716 RepID=UPI0015A15655|nr:diguanylate cyclase [Mariprofundus sp. NF]NWF39349.1 diguanylate cyclase [Mariprofundus sp. NF]